jgi:hypothetical protein
MAVVGSIAWVFDINFEFVILTKLIKKRVLKNNYRSFAAPVNMIIIKIIT